MDTTVALVQSCLHVNGYFTVVEYPVLETRRGVVALCRTPALRAEVVRACANGQDSLAYARSAADVVALLETRPRAVVVETDHADTASVLRRLGDVALPDRPLIVAVTSETQADMPSGADVVATGQTAIISGPTRLRAARVQALDVRAGTACVLAALVADGTTEITDIYHIDRAHEQLHGKFGALGASIERVAID